MDIYVYILDVRADNVERRGGKMKYETFLFSFSLSISLSLSSFLLLPLLWGGARKDRRAPGPTVRSATAVTQHSGNGIILNLQILYVFHFRRRRCRRFGPRFNTTPTRSSAVCASAEWFICVFDCVNRAGAKLHNVNFNKFDRFCALLRASCIRCTTWQLQDVIAPNWFNSITQIIWLVFGCFQVNFIFWIPFSHITQLNYWMRIKFRPRFPFILFIEFEWIYIY